MKDKITIILLLFLAIVAVLVVFKDSRIIKPNSKSLKTYFNYTEQEITLFKDLKTKEKITTKRIFDWYEKTFDLVSRGKLVSGFDTDTGNVYAYLAVAQRDFAILSYQAKQKFAGSIDSISREVLCMSFPDECSLISLGLNHDEYSSVLASIVLTKVQDRVAEDLINQKPSAKKIGPQYWNGQEPLVGINSASLKTWLIRSTDQFVAPQSSELGSAKFNSELLAVQTAMAKSTFFQKQTTINWAGGPGTKKLPGIWLEIVDQYLIEKKVSLEQLLEIHMALAATMADSLSSSFYSKYQYWVKRPIHLDSNLISIMPTPNHPSYPSEHSAASHAAANILSHYLPENKEKWKSKAIEAGISRILGGIHYPMDDVEGAVLGSKIAAEAIKNMP